MIDNRNLSKVLHTLAKTLLEVAGQLETDRLPTLALNCPPIHATSHNTSAQRLATPWPRIGRDDFANGSQITVDHPLFRKNFRKGQTVALYVAGCSSLSQLAARCQLPLFKLGTTLQSDLLIRQEELRIDRYGSAFKTCSGYVNDDGWDDWEMRQLQASLTLSAASPIQCSPRALMMALPRSLPFGQFEKDLQKILDEISLTTWSTTTVGRQHFATLGIDPSVVQRYSIYRFGTRDRHMRAKEIYICRPRTDLAEIAARIEQMIISHVLQHALLTEAVAF